MRGWIAALAAAFGLAAAPACAGEATDVLSKCLVDSTSAKDRVVLVSWIFVGMSNHPEVRRFAAATGEDRELATTEGVKLFERLLTLDCRPALVAAIRADGPESVRTASETVGRLAGYELMGHPAVVTWLAGLTDRMDASKFESIAAEVEAAAAKK